MLWCYVKPFQTNHLKNGLYSTIKLPCQNNIPVGDERIAVPRVQRGKVEGLANDIGAA